MANRYVVSWRADTDDLIAQFGECESMHTLTDTEVVIAILMHGRATIAHANTRWQDRHIWVHNPEGDEEYSIEFENAYD